MPTLYLIDGHAQFFRAYHAIRTAMSSPVTGEPTNLTYGFIGMLLKLLRDNAPDYLAVVIDVSGDRESFRSELDPEYKANRESAPDDFHPQVERCIADPRASWAVPVVGESGVEADDVIATHRAAGIRRGAPGPQPSASSRRDKDLAAARRRPASSILDPLQGRAVVTPSDDLQGRGRRAAEQVPEILALMGDTSDNVPGVPGIGPKTAAKLDARGIRLRSTTIYRPPRDQIKGKRRENLEASRERRARSASGSCKLVEDVLDVEFHVESTTHRFRAPSPIDPGPGPRDVSRALELRPASRTTCADARSVRRRWGCGGCSGGRRDRCAGNHR